MSETRLYAEARIVAAGDQALVVELGEGIDEHVNRRVHALAFAIEQEAIDGVIDMIPAYRSLLLNYDPLRVGLDGLARTLGQLAASLDAFVPPRPRHVEVPTCYGGVYGPDLPFVAEHNGLSEAEVIAIHTLHPCRVFMMGFSPGFAYLGGMSPRIATPRLQTPRTSIPAGSVGIAQQQTGIYPVESPGGWQLIGRTPMTLFDPARTPPTLLQPGDLVRFVAIDETEFERRRADLQVRGEAGLQPRPTDRPHAIAEVLDPGTLTTVQDLGRYGFQRYGVPVSGAMDGFALRAGNLLVGNHEGAPSLEMTIAGPQLRFLDRAIVAVTGADMQPRIGDHAAPMWQPFAVHGDTVLTFRGLRSGARAYLAIAGGFDVPVVLGSRSTYLRSRFGGFNGRPLAQGDRLARLAGDEPTDTRRMPLSGFPTYLESHRLRIVIGPQEAAFTPQGVQTLLSSAYTITAQSDRMGYRLEGPRIEQRSGADIVSDGTPAGAVQVAGDGMPLVLLADRGTTGGYAKIATIIGVDLPRLAQARPGDRVFFDAVTVREAHEALARERALLEQIGSP